MKLPAATGSSSKALDAQIHAVHFGSFESSLQDTGRSHVTHKCRKSHQPSEVSHGGVSAFIAGGLTSIGAQLASGLRRVADSIHQGDNQVKLAGSTPVTVGEIVECLKCGGRVEGSEESSVPKMHEEVQLEFRHAKVSASAPCDRDLISADTSSDVECSTKEMVNEEFHNLALLENSADEKDNNNILIYDDDKDKHDDLEQEMETAYKDSSECLGAEQSGRFPYPTRLNVENYSCQPQTCMHKNKMNCEFNHPDRGKSGKIQGVEKKGMGTENATEKVRKLHSKRTGFYKFGESCRNSHRRGNVSVAPAVEVNFVGLPIRPGEKDCPFYMHNGSCKYEANCMFNHPEPTAGGGLDLPSDGDAVSQSTLPRKLDENGPSVPVLFLPSQIVQDHVNPPDKCLPPPPALLKDNLAYSAEKSACTHHQQQMMVDEVPELPDQPECSFLKKGDSKSPQDSQHKCHHPTNRVEKSHSCNRSNKGSWSTHEKKQCHYYIGTSSCKYGAEYRFNQPEPTILEGWDSYPDGGSVSLPTSPITWNESFPAEHEQCSPTQMVQGEKQCHYYMRTGSCKHGAKCKFNHPEGTASEGWDSYLDCESISQSTTPITWNDSFPVEREQCSSTQMVQGKKQCHYYMHTGSCKHGAKCKFNHPERTASEGWDSYPDCGSVSQLSTPITWTESFPVEREQCLSTQMVQAHVSSPPEGTPPSPSLTLENHQASETSVCTNQREIMVEDSPELPIKSDYRSERKYHRTKMQVPKSPTWNQSDNGPLLTTGEKQCHYYMRTGSCKHGAKCKFNHPERTASEGWDSYRNVGSVSQSTTPITWNESFPVEHEQCSSTQMVQGEKQCHYYMRTGSCKHGAKCKFKHSERTASEGWDSYPDDESVSQSTTPITWNESFPVEREQCSSTQMVQGEKQCHYYMRTGSCKHGAKCKFNHPERTVSEGWDSYPDGGSVSQSTTPITWNESFPVEREQCSSTQMAQAHVSCPPEGRPPSPSLTLENHQASETSVCTHQREMMVEDAPELPIKSDYRSERKYHHTKMQVQKSPKWNQSDNGPLLTTGEKQCHYYMTGSCKHGSKCKFNHPERTASEGWDSYPDGGSVSQSTTPITWNESFPAESEQCSPTQMVQGEKQCHYYMRTGSCKHGAKCKFNHPERTASEGWDSYPNGDSVSQSTTPITWNESFPVEREQCLSTQMVQAEKQCHSHMHTGSCKYHPEPTAAEGRDSYLDGESVSQSTMPTRRNERFPVEPVRCSSTHMVQARINAPPKSTAPSPSLILASHQASETSVCTHQWDMMVGDSLEIPAQPDYRSESKYHRRKMRVQKSPNCNQSGSKHL